MGDVFIERMVKKKFESMDLLVMVGIVVAMIIAVFIGFVVGMVTAAHPHDHLAGGDGRRLWRL